MGELLILTAFLGVFGAGAWLVEGVWHWLKRPESISNAQTTSEKGLW